MKKKVNFLYSLHAGLRFQEKFRKVLFFVAAVGAGFIAIYMGVVSYQKSGVKTDNLQLEAELSDQREMHSMYLMMNEKKKRLLKEKEALEELLEFHRRSLRGGRAWSSLLRDLATALPGGVWLHRFKVSSGTQEDTSQDYRIQVELAGMSYSQGQLLDFVSLMEKDKTWQSVSLQNLKREKNKGAELPDLYQYQISMVMAP